MHAFFTEKSIKTDLSDFEYSRKFRSVQIGRDLIKERTMKTFAAMMFAVMAVVLFSNAAVAKNIGACPSNPTPKWTGNSGEVPPDDKKCPEGTVPGVMGTCKDIMGGRKSQDALDARRAAAVSADGWDGNYCQLPVTAICGSQAAAVACIPLEDFIGGGTGRGSDFGVREAELAEKMGDKALQAMLGAFRTKGCESDDGDCDITRFEDGGKDNIRFSYHSPRGKVEFEQQPDRHTNFHDFESGPSSGVKWLVPLAIGALTGAGIAGMADPSGPDGDVYSLSAAGKGAMIGAAAGLTVSLIWELID